MKSENVSELIGACYEARRIIELMPRLPEGMKPSHIHVMDMISQLQQKKGAVRISDIAAALHVTNPGITRLVNELTEMNAVKKMQDSKDKRVFTVSLTPLGQKYHKKYLEEYHNEMAGKLSDIPEKDIRTAAGVIHEAYRILSDGNMKLG